MLKKCLIKHKIWFFTIKIQDHCFHLTDRFIFRDDCISKDRKKDWAKSKQKCCKCDVERIIHISESSF